MDQISKNLCNRDVLKLYILFTHIRMRIDFQTTRNYSECPNDKTNENTVYDTMNKNLYVVFVV